MQKKTLLVSAIVLLSFITYLFYQYGKRDTVVNKPYDRVGVPDSSWLYGSINLETLRKDIAWSSITNGDFSKLFHTDTTTNTLLQILKSPSSYSITEQNNLHYFSLWKNNKLYSGLLFTIESKDQLLQSFKSNTYKIGSQEQYSFRTNEGYWLYNNQQILFLGKQDQDSVLAHSIFNQTTHSSGIPPTTDSLYATCIIDTRYYQDSSKHPLLDSARVHLSIKKNNACVAIDWRYSGNNSNFFNQVQLTKPNQQTGFYVTCNPSNTGLQKMLEAYQAKRSTKQKTNINFQSFISILQNNTLSIEFKGWKKIKNSFYSSVLNDEFELVLVKKDSSYLEPSFRVSLSQSDKKNTAAFLKYLYAEGLISSNTHSPFKITLGNFDSELSLAKDSSLIYQNTHANRVESTKLIQAGAFIMQLKPNLIQGLYDQRKHFTIDEKYKRIKDIQLEGFKEKDSLYGTAIITFSTDTHPILAFIQLLKNTEQ